MQSECGHYTFCIKILQAEGRERKRRSGVRECLHINSLGIDGYNDAGCGIYTSIYGNFQQD